MATRSVGRVLEAAGTLADITSIGGLLKFTGAVLLTIDRFVKAVGQVPDFIESTKSKLGLWNLHMVALQGLSEDESINEHLKRVLHTSGVLANAQECLERVNEIIVEATPTRKQTRASELWDHAAFRLAGRQAEVEGLLRDLDDIIKHLNIANQTTIM